MELLQAAAWPSPRHSNMMAIPYVPYLESHIVSPESKDCPDDLFCGDLLHESHELMLSQPENPLGVGVCEVGDIRLYVRPSLLRPGKATVRFTDCRAWPRYQKGFRSSRTTYFRLVGKCWDLREDVPGFDVHA